MGHSARQLCCLLRPKTNFAGLFLFEGFPPQVKAGKRISSFPISGFRGIQVCKLWLKTFNGFSANEESWLEESGWFTWMFPLLEQNPGRGKSWKFHRATRGRGAILREKLRKCNNFEKFLKFQRVAPPFVGGNSKNSWMSWMSPFQGCPSVHFRPKFGILA